MTESPLPGCPICGEGLQVLERGSALVAACPEHGMFLGHGDLAVLERGVQGARMGSAVGTVQARRRAYERGVGDGHMSLLSWLLDSARGRVQRRRRSTDAVCKHNAPELDHDNDALVPEGARQCPRCSQKMSSEEREDVWGRTETIVIDVCEPHGVWLDHTELEILLDRAEQGARRRARYRRSREVDGAYQAGFARGRFRGLGRGAAMM